MRRHLALPLLAAVVAAGALAIDRQISQGPASVPLMLCGEPFGLPPPQSEFLGKPTAVVPGSPSDSTVIGAPPPSTVTYSVLRVLSGDIPKSITLRTVGVVPNVGALYDVPIFTIDGSQQAGEDCWQRPSPGNPSRRLGYAPAAHPSAAALQYQAAYNGLTLVLNVPASPQLVTQQRAAIQSFASALSSLALPTSLADSRSALQAATANLLGRWTEAGVDGVTRPVDYPVDTTTRDTLRAWYNQAAALASALGLGSASPVAYPTPSASLAACSPIIPFTRSAYDPTGGVLSISAGALNQGCSSSLPVTMTLVDAQHRPVDVEGNPATVHVTMIPDAIPLQGMVWSSASWGNWCGGPGSYFVHVLSVGYDNFIQLSDPGLELPACQDPTAPSTLTVP